MKSRAAKSRTADLFAAAECRPEAVPAVTRAVAPAAVPAVARAVSSAAVPTAAHAPAPALVPTAAPASRPQAKQLWYAAVFPDLANAAPAALQKLCLYAQAFTSFVSIEPPNALLLEIKGSVKLFGSLETLHGDIDACWRRLTVPAYSATAPSTLAALWLARGGSLAHSAMSGPAMSGPGVAGPGVPRAPIFFEDHAAVPGHLAKLPLACTAWDPQWQHTLHAMGVTCVGELLRLPRAGLARRLNPALVRDLDIALARQASPRRAFVPRERFRERCDFETEIEHVAYLEKALEPLILRCAQFLRRRQAGVQSLQLRLIHRQGPATRVQVGLAGITSESRRLSDVLCQRLSRLELKAPVRSLELLSGSLRGLPGGSLDAFVGLTGAAGRDTAPQLVERLRARLGDEAVYGVALIAEHRPEAAWRRVQELQLTSAPEAREAGFQGMPRPVWLLHEPVALPKPTLLQGPERIESGWWDGKGVARDYYVAQSHGARLWVFQERQSKRWYLHGVFA